jgi:hypothetical protein
MRTANHEFIGAPQVRLLYATSGTRNARRRCTADLEGSRPGHPQELEDCRALNLSAQQRACDDWVITFNHVRPHEVLGMKTREIYRASPRRPGRMTVGGYPGGCRLMDVAKNNGQHQRRRLDMQSDCRASSAATASGSRNARDASAGDRRGVELPAGSSMLSTLDARP